MGRTMRRKRENMVTRDWTIEGLGRDWIGSRTGLARLSLAHPMAIPVSRLWPPGFNAIRCQFPSPPPSSFPVILKHVVSTLP
jgi:hypothetical protein